MARNIVLPSPDVRFVIVHYHMMKNAGSTIVSILEREFDDEFYDVHRESASDAIGPAELASFLVNHPGVKAITSHHIRYPLPEVPSTVVFDCCFIRHPLDRLESLYTYLRVINEESPLGRIAVRSSLAQFLETLLDEHPHHVFNAQTNLLANGGRFTRPPDMDDLQQAIRITQKCAIPGLVDRFDESLTVAEYFLKPAFPKLCLHYLPHNVNRSTSTRLSVKLSRLRAQCGTTLYRQLQRVNELDYRLYLATARELGRRIALVPSFSARLEDLRNRSFTLANTFAQLSSTSSVSV
jgi:Galactose-3-O-sulfotransferase